MSRSKPPSQPPKPVRTRSSVPHGGLAHRRVPGDPLTPWQAAVLAFLRRFIRENGVPPTTREIIRGIGTNSPNGAMVHLASLEAKGVIRRVGPYGNRRIEVVPDEGETTAAEMLAARLSGVTRGGIDWIPKHDGSRVSFVSPHDGLRYEATITRADDS